MIKMKIPVLIFFLSTAITSIISVNNLKEEFTWTRIDYDWGSYRRTRQVQVEERYGHGHHHMQKDESFHFPNTNDEENANNRPGTGRPSSSYNKQNDKKKHEGNRYGNSHNSESLNQNSWSEQLTENNQNQLENIDGPSSSQRRENYIHQNNIPMGAGVWRNKLFITVPRRRHGVPSSLNYVDLSSPNKYNTPLIPYPNWEMNALPESYNSSSFSSDSLTRAEREKFVSVYRVAVDACDRLWFVDTGLMEIPNGQIQVQRPKLVIMDLNTDTVLRSFTFPESDLRSNSLLAHVVVEMNSNDCKNAHAYMPDVNAYGLIIYSFKENKSWRVTHNYFYLESLRGEFQIAGYTFQWNDGIFSTALSAPNRNGERYLYFHSMAGSHLYRVSTDILKNETTATRSYHGQDFESLGDRGERSQTSASALDESTGILFLGLVNQNALACWNINRPLRDISIVQKDDEKMIYPCDLKIYNDKIYLLTNTMPGFLYGQLDYDKVNFRIWVQNVQEAVQGTKCVANNSGNRNENFSQTTKNPNNNRKGGYGHSHYGR